MDKYLDKLEVVLGSKSPRRKELLSSIGLNLRVQEVDVEESYPEELTPEQVVCFLAAKKNQAYKEVGPNEVFLTSDTIVVLDGEILGKPVDIEEAKSMLYKLSGTSHEVITAVCLNAFGKKKTIMSKTRVRFKELKSHQVNFYVKNENPLDKAGAYGIQDWIGKVAVKEIEGCYYNVMGLPLNKVVKELGKLHDEII